MGLNINQDSKGTSLPTTKKAAVLIKDGAKELKKPPDIYQKNLVCVIENGPFNIAVYACSEREFEYFRNLQKSGRETRLFIWLICTDEQITQNK